MVKKIKFNKAIAFFKQKLPLPTETANQIIDEAQDWAFTITGVEKAQLLQSVFDLITQILEGRSQTVTTYEEFAQKFNQLMAASGYSESKPWRTRLVYKMNTRQAYNAGRYRTQTDFANKKRRPYLQYLHGHPLIPRPHHKVLHKKIWRADDPIWGYIYPLNGYGCNCSVTSLSDRDLEREGLSVSPTLTERITIRDRISGSSQQVPAITLPLKEFEASGIPPGSIVEGGIVTAPIAEPGFNYAPGASTERDRILKSSLSRLSPRLREIIEQEGAI